VVPTIKYPTINDVSSGELVARARQNDQAAWDALIERYTGLLRSIARSYDLGVADIADVTQTVWLRLVERLDELREPDRVATWLAVTTHRESRGTLRRRGRELPTWTVPDQAQGPDHGCVERTCVQRERLSDVASAIRAMPERCRRVLRFFALAPVTYAEVAAALDIPIGSVGPTRTRCLAGLRRRLGAAK
jgi:RNA polymerase sigma factor (sigma-70 family)